MQKDNNLETPESASIDIDEPYRFEFFIKRPFWTMKKNKHTRLKKCSKNKARAIVQIGFFFINDFECDSTKTLVKSLYSKSYLNNLVFQPHMPFSTKLSERIVKNTIPKIESDN